MHPTILASQRGQALERISQASQTLTVHLQLDPALIEALQPQVKDPQVKELRRLEAVATLLETLVVKSNVITLNVPGVIEETVPAEAVTVETASATPAPLPAPVIKTEKPAAKKTRSRKAKS